MPAELGLTRLATNDNKDWEVSSDISIFTSEHQSAITVGAWDANRCRCCFKVATITVAWGVPVALLVAIVALLVPNAAGGHLHVSTIEVQAMNAQALSLGSRRQANDSRASVGRNASAANGRDGSNCTADGNGTNGTDGTNASANASSCADEAANATSRSPPPPPRPPAALDWGNPKAAYEGFEKLNERSDGFFTAWWNGTRAKLLLEVPAPAASGSTAARGQRCVRSTRPGRPCPGRPSAPQSTASAAWKRGVASRSRLGSRWSWSFSVAAVHRDRQRRSARRSSSCRRSRAAATASSLCYTSP